MTASISAKSTQKSTPWYRTMRGREAITFYLFITPWIIGFVLFTIGPIIASLGLKLYRLRHHAAAGPGGDR